VLGGNAARLLGCRRCLRHSASFVAVELPAKCARRSVVSARAPAPRPRETALGAPRGIHLTLKFLGETPVNRVPEIEEALARTVSRMASHKLALECWVGSGVGVPASSGSIFGGDLHPVQTCRNGWNQTRGRGLPRGPLPSAHLTLARVRPDDAEAATALPAALEAVRLPTGVIPIQVSHAQHPASRRRGVRAGCGVSARRGVGAQGGA
jgi:hypothetical protein